MVAHRKRGTSRKFDPALIVVGLYVTLLTLFGGGNTVFGPTLMLLMVTTCLFVGATIMMHPVRTTLPMAAIPPLALIVALPLLQLIPLPPAIWQALPGSSLRKDVLTLIGRASEWQPLSLEPVYTAQTAVMAAGFVTLVIALEALSPRSFRRILILILMLTCLGIFVGTTQVTTRGTFPRFFTNSDAGVLIGFYANKNHMALAIAASLPLANALLRTSVNPKLPVRRLAFFVYWGVGLIAIIATTSRAGLALGLLASLTIAFSAARGISLRQRLLIAAVVIMIAAAVAFSNSFQLMMARFDYIGNDDRLLFTQHSLPLLRQYWLTGAGGGVFEDLFITKEVIGWVKPTITNHVHNDYIELAIEYGLAGILALAAFGTLVIRAGLDLRGVSDRSRALRWTGLSIIALVALHSCVDYPLRRPAILVLLAVALVMAIRQGEPERGISAA